MPSLSDLQRRFAGTLLAKASDADERVAIYRNTVFANYRNALGATYPVVRLLTGAPFFNAAVDAFALAHPSTGGDLNVYGSAFGQFLAAYPHAGELPYLPDVARLEWVIDEAHRAADGDVSPERLLAALAAVPGEEVALTRFTLDPSCRLLRSEFPILRIWHAHQDGGEDMDRIAFDAGVDLLLVRREAGAVGIERVAPDAFAWLTAIATGADLANSLDAAIAADSTFDLGATLRARIGDGTVAGIFGGR